MCYLTASIYANFEQVLIRAPLRGMLLCTGTQVATQLPLWTDTKLKVCQHFRGVSECERVQRRQQAQGQIPACSHAQR
jgi:hypothetical protein